MKVYPFVYSKNGYDSLCFLLFAIVDAHEVKTNDDERNAQPLSHVECHAFFEAHLVLFEEFNKETESEDGCQTKSEVETTVQFLIVVFV